MLMALSLCACDNGGGDGAETIPTEPNQEHSGEKVTLPEVFCGVWHFGDGRSVEIRPDLVSVPGGIFTEFTYSEEHMLIEVMKAGELVYSVHFVDEETILVVGVDGSEIIYHTFGNGEEIHGDSDWEDPVDEEMRLWLAYDKAVQDFDAAVFGKPVYDEEGKEIYDGPVLAQYLYDQFVALGDFEDAAYYLPFFKTREETVATVQESSCNAFGDVHVTVYDGDLPNYDVFGEPSNTRSLLNLGIFYSQPGKQQRTKVYNENNMLTQVVITSTNTNDDVIDTCVADLEYNEMGQHIATHVTFVDENGTDVRYTSTLEYDNNGNLVRIDIPYYIYNQNIGTYTSLDAYDEQGRILRSTAVSIPKDLDVFEHQHKRPFFRTTKVYFYDDRGLLTHIYWCNMRGDGSTFYKDTYSYDENGLLIEEKSYNFVPDYNGMYNSGEYTIQEIDDIEAKMVNGVFHLNTSYEERLPEDWISNEHFELSEWEWIPHTIELKKEYTYTYDKTVTIMYIDLTPED